MWGKTAKQRARERKLNELRIVVRSEATEIKKKSETKRKNVFGEKLSKDLLIHIFKFTFYPEFGVTRVCKSWTAAGNYGVQIKQLNFYGPAFIRRMLGFPCIMCGQFTRGQNNSDRRCDECTKLDVFVGNDILSHIQPALEIKAVRTMKDVPCYVCRTILTEVFHRGSEGYPRCEDCKDIKAEMLDAIINEKKNTPPPRKKHCYFCNSTIISYNQSKKEKPRCPACIKLNLTVPDETTV